MAFVVSFHFTFKEMWKLMIQPWLLLQWWHRWFCTHNIQWKNSVCAAAGGDALCNVVLQYGVIQYAGVFVPLAELQQTCAGTSHVFCCQICLFSTRSRSSQQSGSRCVMGVLYLVVSFMLNLDPFLRSLEVTVKLPLVGWRAGAGVERRSLSHLSLGLAAL